MRYPLVLAMVAMLSSSGMPTPRWQPIGEGQTPLPGPLHGGQGSTGFVATARAQTKAFERWLTPGQRVTLGLIDYRRTVVVAAFAAAPTGSEIDIDSVRVRHPALRLGIVVQRPPTGIPRGVAAVYELSLVPRKTLGRPIPKRVVTSRRFRDFGPPSATLVTSRGEGVTLALGDICWKQAGLGICATTIPPEARTDLPRVVIKPGEIVTFRLGFDPSELTLALIRGARTDRFDLPPSREARWHVPPATSVSTERAFIDLFARVGGGTRVGEGSVNYLAALTDS